MVIHYNNNVFLYSATTYIDSEVDLIDIQLFKQLIMQNPKFAFKVINVLNENTVQTYSRFHCFTNKQMHGRIADTLLYLSADFLDYLVAGTVAISIVNILEIVDINHNHGDFPAVSA